MQQMENTTQYASKKILLVSMSVVCVVVLVVLVVLVVFYGKTVVNSFKFSDLLVLISNIPLTAAKIEEIREA